MSTSFPSSIDPSTATNAEPNTATGAAPAASPVARESYEAAFDATRADRAALEPTDLKLVFTDVMTAASRARSAGIRAEKHDAAIEALGIVTGLRARLIRYADAAAGAHIRLVNANEKPPVIIPMIEELRAKRDVLANDVRALVSRNLVPAKRLDGLNGTTGHRAIAYDVMILAGGLLQEWDKVAGRTGATRAELEQLREMAQAADTAVSLREDQERERDEAADARQRAFTLLVIAHAQMTRAMTFILWDEGPDAIAAAVPPLQSGRPRKSKSAVDEDEDALDGATGTASSTVVSNGAGSGPSKGTGSVAGNGGATNGAAAAPKLNPFLDD